MRNIFAAVVTLVLLAMPVAPVPNSVHAQNTIFACKNVSDGTLRIVASTTCNNSEIPISWPSAPPRFVDNGNGTITDNQTGLMWEKKLADNDIAGNCAGRIQTGRSPHCVKNRYFWSFPTHSGDTLPNGSVFDDFLVRINSELSKTADLSRVDVAGYHDWRIPNIAELRTIVPATCPTTGPCIDPIFGPTATNDYYWSSSAIDGDPTFAAGVRFDNGAAIADLKNFGAFARAVRGGR
jgi:hypothetical protein